MDRKNINRGFRKQYVSQCRIALNQPETDDTDANTHQSWAERQAELTGIDPLLCLNCDLPLFLKEEMYITDSENKVTVQTLSHRRRPAIFS